MSWNDKTSVKKGNIGENIVKNVLEENGYILYKSITDKAHAFDFLAIKDKKIFMIVEVKSKARLNKYAATGINVKSFNEYKYILNNQHIDMYLFFVDEHPKEQRIYGQKLSVLMERKTVDGVDYPNFTIANGIVLFSLTDMLEVCKLTKEQINELKQFNNRNYLY